MFIYFFTYIPLLQLLLLLLKGSFFNWNFQWDTKKETNTFSVYVLCILSEK